MKKPVASAIEITSKKCGISAKDAIPTKCGISADVARKFRVWFERNLAGFRSGLIGGVEYRRAGALDDRPGDDYWYANAYDRAVLDYTESATPAEEDFIRSHPLIVLQLLLGLTDMRGIRCMRRGLTQRINSLQQKSYRSRYYEKDNRRRRILAAARRKIHHRTTLNPCPTPDEFRAAFAMRNDSVEARIYFGGMVHDLECYVDNCLRINDAGEIVGRNGGIKHWLADNVPELYERYKTIMRYKALVKRIRQAVQVCDPVPTSDLLADGGAQAMQQADAAVGREVGEAQATMKVASNGMPMGDKHKNYYALESHRRRRKVAAGRVKDIFEGCANTMVGAFRVVDDYLDRNFDELGCVVVKKARNGVGGDLCT